MNLTTKISLQIQAQAYRSKARNLHNQAHELSVCGFTDAANRAYKERDQAHHLACKSAFEALRAFRSFKEIYESHQRV